MTHLTVQSGSEFKMNKTVDQAFLLNGSALAYMGDAIYETYIRRHVLATGVTRVNQLHRKATKFVSASGQAKIMTYWLKKDTLSEQELTLYKRGRNHRANTKAKNASIQDYRQATGFEALLGWLYLTDQTERLEELINQAIDYIENGEE
ncbi:ribonuclease-3 family protein [Dolosicoccus paucivorans]|nr:ribonuclease-3 family protein [Dolosicoccus paucivorans]